MIHRPSKEQLALSASLAADVAIWEAQGNKIKQCTFEDNKGYQNSIRAIERARYKINEEAGKV